MSRNAQAGDTVNTGGLAADDGGEGCAVEGTRLAAGGNAVAVSCGGTNASFTADIA